MTIWENELIQIEKEINALDYYSDLEGENLEAIEKRIRDLANWLIGKNEKTYKQLMQKLNSSDLSDLLVSVNGGKITREDWISTKDTCVEVLNVLKFRAK